MRFTGPKSPGVWERKWWTPDFTLCGARAKLGLHSHLSYYMKGKPEEQNSLVLVGSSRVSTGIKSEVESRCFGVGLVRLYSGMAS